MTEYQQIKFTYDNAFPGFRIGCFRPLAPENYSQILSNLITGRSNDKAGQVMDSQVMDNQVLGGRSSIKIFQMPGKEQMVVKPFLRGGFFRFFVKKRYFRFFGESRAHLEFNMLSLARRLGISVSEPLGFIEQGRFWYRCWLVTKLVPQADTLAALALRDTEKAQEVMPCVMDEIDLMVRHGMVHADLHPGNVLISRENGVWLIDFDKACQKNIDPDLLFQKYRKRWNRAVVKHCLPPLLRRLFTRPRR